MTSVQYPGSGPTWLPVTGPNLGWAFDNMGRLNTMTDLAASSTIISGATYGPSNELLTMSGLLNESRSYNSMLQLTGLTSGSTVSMTYGYSSTQNNGKIISQSDAISGETVQYTYDALNRLASATATNSSWGQSYQYDGFGNLTNQNVTAGSAPSFSTSYDANNHGSCVDANGNNTCAVDGAGHGFNYDVENRASGLSNGAVLYNYTPGNKRVWRGLFTSGTLTTDEVTFWGVNGQKLAVYQLTYTNQAQQGQQANWVWYASQTGTNYYFGSKLIKNASGYVGSDRLGSIGKYYPYGQEKPSATTNGTEKFTGYFRDAETGLDYADQRYHSPGTGRFMTADPYQANGGGNGNPRDPGSWNRYAYAGADPINHKDPTGQDWCWVGDYFDCLVTQPGANPGDFQISISLQLANLAGALALLADEIASEIEAATPDCTVKVSYRPVLVGGKDTGKNHLIVTTIVSGVQTVYEGEPEPSPPLPNSACVPVGNTACPTNSLLVGVTSTGGQKGLGTPYKTIADAGYDCGLIAYANTKYNSHQLHYTDNGAPNSNSYAYTLLKFAGLLGDVGLPPSNVPGWGYDVIVNPQSLP